MSKDARDVVGNLPIELTSFVGRRRELTQVKQRLQDARLVTLTGVGGVGKTRLALRAGAVSRRAFRDSVWLVELGDLRNPDLVAESVATALHLVQRTNQPIRQLLKEYLASRQLLLVLDNCEHLLDATAGLAAALLQASPEIRIIATSREPLNIEGEAVVRVPPLEVPDSAASSNSSGQVVSDAVALFTERARFHVSEFELTTENRDTVIEICRKLDGLPLPIELAAARLRTLSPSQILEHLTDRYRLLTAGRRGIPLRQQTLQSSVDWSRDLCSPDEQRLWGRLSVFAGGAELEAIEQICSSEPITTDMLDLVGSLVDKSIVIRDQIGADARYRMLDILREYGRAQLISSGEYADTRRRHRDWFADLSARAADEWLGPNGSAWAARLGREQANLREGLEYCFTEPAEEEAGARIATALYPFWLTGGHFSEGRRWLGRSLRIQSVDPSFRARAALLDSVLADLQGDTPSAASLINQARAMIEPLGDPQFLALLSYAEGYLALYRGENDRAATNFESAAGQFRAQTNRYLQFGSVLGLGLAHIAANRVALAVPCCNEALALTAIGELPELQAYPLWTFGIALWLQGDSVRATHMLNRALELARHADPLVTAWCLQVLAWIAASNNLERRAATLIGASEMFWRQMGGEPVSIPGLEVFHGQSLVRVQRVLGSRDFKSARTQGAAMNRDEAVAFALEQRPTAQHAPAGELMKLTKREREVSAMVAQGLTNKAIAEALVLSQRTAQGHVENILTKLGFTSRSQIAAWFVGQQ